MAQLITLSILGGCIAVAVGFGIVALVLTAMGSPSARRASLPWMPVRAPPRLTASPVVAFPSMVDPLCDYFDWFGNAAANKARDYAYVVNAPIIASRD